mmetsp:Transcript_937/g.2145  ORF Transcript_937/g.2145 Transcript_937/m.2145 type:complete len:205 (+) Transcript_937:799-1413(+)
MAQLANSANSCRQQPSRGCSRPPAAAAVAARQPEQRLAGSGRHEPELRLRLRRRFDGLSLPAAARASGVPAAGARDQQSNERRGNGTSWRRRPQQPLPQISPWKCLPVASASASAAVASRPSKAPLRGEGDCHHEAVNWQRVLQLRSQPPFLRLPPGCKHRPAGHCCTFADSCGSPASITGTRAGQHSSHHQCNPQRTTTAGIR